MDFDRYFTQEWRSVASEATGSEGLGNCFDCNICFEFAREPVVTLCGHLYCWPCIYKWLHVQSASLAPDEHPQCPVCKARISHTRVVPLYGHGQAPAEAELEGKTSSQGMVIPPRPAAVGSEFLVSNARQTGQRHPYQNHTYNPNRYNSFEEPPVSPLVSLGGGALTRLHHPFVGMFGGMVYPIVFGNSENLYAYPNSYHLVGGRSPRLRRHEMQADLSLNRILIFLVCCVLVCLVVF
uniref:E3 ubiquitin-protein ligase RMA n=1 Tax=Rhizophora mucronata TaxID=61149 RepID=A0A2P2JC62_RHIMU